MPGSWHPPWRWVFPTFWRAALTAVFLFCTQTTHADLEDRDWALYRTDFTDVLLAGGDEQAAQLIRDIALFRSIVSFLSGTPPFAGEPRRATFLVLEDGKDLQRLFATPAGINGFTRPSLAGDLMVVVRPRRASTFNTGNQVVFHEYVHQLLQMRSASRQPTWYAEGIADFLSTVSVQDGQVILGEAPAARRWSLLNETPMPLAEVLDVGSALALSAEDRNRFYARAWSLVHHLLLADDRVESRFAPRLTRYLQKFDAGEPSAAAFMATFGALAAQMDERLVRHLAQPRIVEYPLATFEFSSRHETRSLTRVQRILKLAGFAREFDAQSAERLYRKALRLAPGNPAAVAGLAVTLGHAGDFAGANALMASLDPTQGDPFVIQIETGRLGLLQCRAQPKDCRESGVRDTTARAFAAALALRPDNVEAKTRHAQHLLLTERRAEAMPLLLAAHAAAPWSFDVVQSLGLAYMARGDLVRARLHLRKALGWAIDYPALRAELATLLDGIEALEARQRRLPLGGDIDESSAVQ